MALADLRQRTAVLFIAVVLGHIILISAQVNSRGGVPLLEVVTFGTFAEVQRWASGLTASVRNGWLGYANLRGVKVENERLKQQLSDIQVRFQQEHAAAERARQLEHLLGFQQQIKIDTVAVHVIGAGATPDSRTVTIDKGSSSGVERDMAVLAPTGVIGRVVTSTPHAAKVQLLLDRNAGAGALIQRSRAQGVVVGAGEELMQMKYVSSTADVKVGDTVVTSGIDGIYPTGFVVGSVETVDKGGGGYKLIHVRPAADFSRLEEALVVTSRPAQAATFEDAR